MYGFEGEVKQKYSSQMVELFTEVFNYLPLAHIIGGKILVRLYSEYSYCMYMYIVTVCSIVSKWKFHADCYVHVLSS